MEDNRKEQLIELAEQKMRDNRVQLESDPYRLKYHVMPPVGLLNDPNGLIYYRGHYHLFYQWNPFATKHGTKFWAHCISNDLIDWCFEEIALTPSEWFDRNGCYSGSAIEYEGKMVLFYTGNVKNSNGNRETYQCVAISEDGRKFHKKGPVIYLPEGFTAHFRDPKVFRRNNRFYMVIGAQDINKYGCCVMFVSNNLEQWSYQGVLAGSMRNGLDDYGYMWECPDLFTIDGRDILLVCPQGMDPKENAFQNKYQSGYFIGKMDYEKTVFHTESFIELDRGFDFYAPQTMVDAKGRRLLFAWMGMTDEREALHPTIAHDWVHAMTIPRELFLSGEKLCQRPVAELQNLRSNLVKYHDLIVKDETRDFPDVYGKVLELLISDIMLDSQTRFCLDFRGHAQLVYDTNEQRLILKRMSLLDRVVEKRSCNVEELHKLQIFMDTSSLEIFVNGGEEVFTARIFPEQANETITFSTSGNARFDLQKWDLANGTA